MRRSPSRSSCHGAWCGKFAITHRPGACRSASWSVERCADCWRGDDAVARRPTRRHALQLEYRFDRVLAVKLEQVYQLLVPNTRRLGGVSSSRGSLTLEGINA